MLRFVATYLLQVEKDSFIWWEKEVNWKHEIADIGRTISFLSESRIAELEQSLRKLADERVMLESKLEAATRGSSILSSCSVLIYLGGTVLMRLVILR